MLEIKDGSMSNFPGDITEFLSLKKADSIAQFEQKQKKQRGASKPKKSNEKEKWNLKKKVSSVEREIDKLEVQIEELKKEGGSLDFSDHELVKKHMESVSKAESKLARRMEEWESLSSELDEM